MNMVEELLERNYSIIPMKMEPAKEPAIHWKYYQRKRATIREIEKWHKQFGETNYAIVCGLISDLGVIDVDDLKQIPTLKMMLPDLFNTCVIKTPRPGLQFYFKLQGRLIRSTFKLFGLTGVELRCEGRYVMSPGSVIKGIEYIFERPLTYILPIPKIIIDLYQETYKETVIIKEIETPRVRAKCISQILNYDLLVGQRKLAYHIAYCKMRQEGHLKSYAISLCKLANSKISLPLREDEFDFGKIYYYGCPRINEELSFIDCSSCQVRGGLKVGSLAMRSFHKLKSLTNTQRAILLILDTYFRGEKPTIYEIQKYSDTNINYYTIKNALEVLKEKKII